VGRGGARFQFVPVYPITGEKGRHYTIIINILGWHNLSCK